LGFIGQVLGVLAEAALTKEEEVEERLKEMCHRHFLHPLDNPGQSGKKYQQPSLQQKSKTQVLHQPHVSGSSRQVILSPILQS
jgi:hypothetical protein